MICGLSVLDSFAGSSDTTVVLARCNTGSSARNRVCSFRLADIDDKMDRKYAECAGGTGDIQVAWDSTGSCTSFQVILKCNRTLVIYTAKRFRLLQPYFGHLSCIPFVCVTCKVQGMLTI